MLVIMMVGAIIFGFVAESIKNTPDPPRRTYTRGVAKASPSNRERSADHTTTTKPQAVTNRKIYFISRVVVVEYTSC